jgi:hypothetical protein
MDDIRNYRTVQTWLEGSRPKGFQPVPENWDDKLTLLDRYFEHIGVDPDTLIATSTDLVPDGKATRNRHLKALKQWVQTLPVSDYEKTKTENLVRGFFVQNAIKVTTRPYSDVYRRPAAPAQD